MKALLVLFLSLFSLMSCLDVKRSRQGEWETQEEELPDSTPKATAIFWVDKGKYYQVQKKAGPIPIRTVKAQVDIDSLGKVKLLSYVKQQSLKVQNYLQYRLEYFRVKKIMLDSGYVKPGIQYVQLRYIPEKLNTYR